ncbi:M1 family metallopeptidase [Candidatus Saccharibacteria bacterium]|nr:M1 family metallopeptidase [Candidatus Saccharibacteria bacterium]MBI3338113.1 M1 family metallopeptidase [Candidatus Saccharibacteria bacterium]
MNKKVRRLYKQFQPSHYVLDLIPDPENMVFSGSVTVSGQKTGRPSQRLTFHQNGLKITRAHITRHDKKGDYELDIDRINNHNSFNEVRIHTKAMAYPGKYTVRLEFEGKITRSMNGIYPCYFEYKGKKKQLIATQFESHHAREAFPCIDEPEAKATFQLSLTHTASETVLSNTPIKQSKVIKLKVKSRTITKHSTTFETTPRMSTYLLAFVIGSLDFRESKANNGAIVRAYATPNNVQFTNFALDVAVKCLDFFNDYFGIEYPLEKCDLIALPDFASGAMENWGCITFREQTLLVDPKNSTLGNKQYVAMVIAHELAHQWFGNLVTMRWWTDLWLNEGFASWIEYLAVDHLFPEWKMWIQFIVDEQQQALKLDALENTHPVEVPVNHPDEIRTIFDTISYSKGASVIHMLHQFLGPEVFRDGLRHYLVTHAYGNTDTVDLWTALEKVSHKPVKEFMQAWTSTPGFPLIHADFKNNSTMHVEQERFILNPAHSPVPESLWPAALLPDKLLTTKDATYQIDVAKLDLRTTPSFQLESARAKIVLSEGEVDLATSTEDKLFVPETIQSGNERVLREPSKLNHEQGGFYRTIYNTSHLEYLGKQILRGKLSPQDRLGLLSDVFETAKAGKSSTAVALKFLTNFQYEDNYAVWDVMAGALGNIRLIMDDSNLREDMKPFIRKLISLELKRVGWDRQPHESYFDRMLRPTILSLASAADEDSIIKRCQKLFASIDYTEDSTSGLKTTARQKVAIDPDLRGIVFGTVARLGGKIEFNKLLMIYKASTLSEERTILAAALTSFKQPEIIKQALAKIDSNDVRLQDVSYWIAYSLLNHHARKITWQWLKDNWSWLEENIGTDLSFSRLPIYVARVFSDEAFIDNYKEFFEQRLTPVIERSYKQGLEMLEWQAAWKKRDLKEIKAFFDH